MAIYDVGDLVRLTAAFTDSNTGALKDPSVVRMDYKTPSGTKTSLVYPTDPALVKDSTGNYHVDISITESGTWWYRWYSTGTGQAAEEGRIHVRERRVT